MTNPFHPFTPPFRYDPKTDYILDANGTIALGMSGWDEKRRCYSGLISHPVFGEHVCKVLNEHAMKEGL